MKKGLIIAIIVICLIIAFLVYQKWQLSVANSVVRESGVDVSNIVRMEYATTIQEGSDYFYDEYEDYEALDELMNELEDMQYVTIDTNDDYKLELLENRYLKFVYESCFMIIENNKGQKNEITIYDFREYNSKFAVVVDDLWRVFWVSEEDAFCNTVFKMLRQDYGVK